MKHNLLKSVIISVILLLGANSVWGASGTITVYFKNTVNWSNVYVYFLTSSYWDETKGCGSYGYTAKQMTYDNTLGLYKCTYTGNYSGYITFTKDKQDNYGNFWETEAVYRSDFSTTSPIYVPSNTSNETKNSTKYYNNGSWVSTTKQTVYYIGTLTTPYAYIWNSNNGNHSNWPGETMTDSGKKYHGKTIYSVTTPYSFNNILFSNNGNNQTADLILEANKIYDHTNSKWITYNYDVTVSFNSNGKGSNPVSQTVLKGNKVTTPVAPSITGYSVEGWYTEEACTNKWDFNSVANADMTLYAKWAPAQYTINYKDQGNANFSGNHAAGAPTKHTYGTATTLSTASKDGYTFGGWYKEKECTTTVTTLGATEYTSAPTLYAKWTANPYTVTLNNQGATTAGTASVQAIYGSAMPSATMPQKTGYTFGGYFKNSDGTGTQYYNANGTSQTNWNIAENTTLYAKWAANKYTVKFNGNGSTSGSMSNQSFNYDETKALTANAFQKTGYTFAGWNTAANGSGTTYSDKQSVSNLSSTNGTTINLYAQWTALPANTVYLHPVDFWPDANARFAVYAWTGSNNKWIEMEAVGCEREYFKANIPAEYTSFNYVRLNPAGKGNANKNDGLHWEYKWNQTSDLSVQAGAGKMYTTPRMYLKPNANWKTDGARFAAYFFVEGDDTKTKWMSMLQDGDIYWCNIPTEEAYNRIIFCRMKPDTEENIFENKWNQTADLTIDNNLYTITENEWGTGTWSTNWDTYTSTTTLTLKSSSNGKYHVIHKGTTYESSLTEDVNIQLPLYSEIIISNVADARPGYTFKKRFIKIGTNAKVEATTNTPYQLCGSTTITADFVIEGPQTVYLKPNSNWTANNARFAIYVYDEVGNNKWYNMTSAAGGYYTCTIEAGWSNLIFVRMNPANNDNKFEDGYSWNQTLSHAIPVTRYNTYVLDANQANGEGYWTHTPTFANSYRLRYVEQVVEKTQTWKTTITETLASHSIDDVIPQKANSRDTISYYINVDGDNPEVVLEQYNGSTWEVKERRMINGPLETTADMAMLPGRRNTSGSGNPQLIYDNGIDAINESGVWNFIIVQDGSGNATIKVDETHLYDGKYYLRTNNTAGGWNTYTHLDNHMKLSTNAESGYTHYYCKWVNITESSPNVKFIVANDYSTNVSREFTNDDYTAGYGDLVENANVRWSWNEKTGERSRAYIQGANKATSLVLDYTTNGTTNGDDKSLNDSGDWIYTQDIDIQSGATLESLKATYPSAELGGVKSQVQTFIQGPIDLITGMSDQVYTVRVTYDFKNNKATTFLIPGAGEVNTAIDVMIERVNQEEAKQVQAAIRGINSQDFSVCAVMSFTKEHLNKNSLHNDLRQFYWISFPFNVNIEDVYGFGTYGVHWILEEYNGARRAKDGLWLDSPSFWEFILDPKDKQIEANKGYLLCLDLDLLGNNSDVFANTDKVSLYFPSTETVTGINAEYTITEVPVSTHIRTETRANRHIYDSNWNLIGVPSYANKDQSSTPTNLQYFYDYKYNESTKKMEYVAKSSTNGQFNSMYAYFVQWGGTLNWSTLTGTDNTPREELQARKNANYEEKKHDLRLELLQNSTKADQTFISLQEGDVTTAFDLNQDMTKIINAGANIYTLAGTEMIQLAANVLPIANTVIPVGVQIATAGEYTFAMPDGTDGIVVELIDYETNTRTNLMLDEYTVDLAAGTNEARFALHVKPSKVTTSLEDGEITTNGKVRKFLIDGVLYLQKDGNIYDAQGKLIR